MWWSIRKVVVGTTVGTKATIVPLVVAAFPFVARLVETSLRELDEGVVEAAQSMGATPFQIITKVMIPECLPGLISSMTTALTTILGYSAMSGAIGGGGLGKVAISYGYYRYQTNIMIVCVVLLVLMVQVNGPLVRSYASCEEYYRSWASTWEHQALLRARYAAGDERLAKDFLHNIADPLRYPQSDLTETELGEIRKLKARMEAERLPRGVRRERHLKLGKGGLSDIEWTVQLMQLRHAAAHGGLRVNSTLPALDELERLHLIDTVDAAVLRKAWCMCTAARNGNYLWSGRAAQADILPDDIYSLGGIAVYLGYDANRGQHFENDLLAVMRRSRDVTERLFYGRE